MLGAAVTLAGASVPPTTTDADGNYNFSVIDGSYTISAAKSGYVFSAAIPVTVNNANVTGQNFTATLATYKISGTITSGGLPLSGVSVALTGASTGTTNTDNTSVNYNFSVNNGSYTVTPSSTHYNFTPASLSVTVNNSDVTGNSFTASINYAYYAYVANEVDNTVSAYSIDPTGKLTAIGTVDAGVRPQSVTVDPSGKYAYVANLFNDSVSAYSIDSTGDSAGALTAIGNALPVGSHPMSVIVDPSGKYVYVAKYGDGRSNNGTVSAYSITTSGSTSGALTPIGNAVTAGTGPRSIVTVRIAQ